VIIIAY